MDQVGASASRGDGPGSCPGNTGAEAASSTAHSGVGMSSGSRRAHGAASLGGAAAGAGATTPLKIGISVPRASARQRSCGREGTARCVRASAATAAEATAALAAARARAPAFGAARRLAARSYERARSSQRASSRARCRACGVVYCGQGSHYPVFRIYVNFNAQSPRAGRGQTCASRSASDGGDGDCGGLRRGFRGWRDRATRALLVLAAGAAGFFFGLMWRGG